MFSEGSETPKAQIPDDNVARQRSKRPEEQQNKSIFIEKISVASAQRPSLEVRFQLFQVKFYNIATQTPSHDI